MQDCPECFGSPQKSSTLDCNSCEYSESCRYCSENALSDKSGSLGHVSYDRYSYSKDVACNDEDCVDETHNEEDDSVRRVIEFLLDIDNYSAELLSEVLHGNANTTSDLARKFGVSRQAIHRKIVDCCTLHPELRKLFIARLYNCRRIMRDSERINKLRNKNSQQMRFNF